MSEVCFILNKDAEDWPDYIRSLFKNASTQKTRTELDTVLFRSKTYRPQSAVTVIIISHGHLEFLRENVDFNYKDLVPDPDKAILFMLGVKTEDLNIRGSDRLPLTSRFSNFAKWKQFDHEHSQDMVVHIEQQLKSLKGKKPLPCVARSFKLVPDVARSEDPTVITIFFDEGLTTAAKVEALISDDESGRVTIVIPTERRNAFSFTFVAPEHQEGVANFRILVDGKLAGSSQLKYVSSVDKYSALSQIYIHQLSKLCNLLTKSKVSSTDIDNCLSSIFDPDASSESVIPIEAFELLFGIYRYASDDSSEVELPTMLHFAAKHGLKELTAKLTDLPDASFAHTIRNCDNKMAEDLARSNKHSSLTLFLENFREVNEGFEDLYVKCHGYVNADGPANAGDLSGYLKAKTRMLESTESADYIVLYPSDVGEAAAEAEEDDIYYMYVPSNSKLNTSAESNANRLSTASSAGKKTPQKSSAPPATASRGPVLSGDQQQLVEIMQMYKSKKCSMAEVESLFKQWKHQYQAASNVKSFRDKQEKLKKMKEDVVKARTQGEMSPSQTRQHRSDGTPALPPRAK